MSDERGWSASDLARLDDLIASEEEGFKARQPRSARLLERAGGSLAGGVTSSWQIAWPQPIWIDGGSGSKVRDVDGHEYVDLHGGYGVGICGHGHPSIVKAVSERVPRGTHFAQPTEDAIVVAEDLAARFGLPLWRFGNSGTEVTMDAVHLMRAATGRDVIVKIEGCYHGHHDSVMVSVANDLDEIGPPESPYSAPSGTGIPAAVTDLTRVVPFNDLPALERAFESEPGAIAGVILEPIMMNAGIIPPEDDYLRGVQELVGAHGALLTFDEVKTGLTVAHGGVCGELDYKPDLVTLAKAVGGGLSCGAIGGSEDVMGLIVSGDYEQVGTFNGNPLAMAASRAALTEVLTESAYDHLERLRKQMVDGSQSILDSYGLPAYALGFGAKGSITFTGRRVRNYRDFLSIDNRFSHAHWLFQFNGGVFLPPWGKAEQWMLSVQHTEEDVQHFLANLERFARALRS